MLRIAPGYCRAERLQRSNRSCLQRFIYSNHFRRLNMAWAPYEQNPAICCAASQTLNALDSPFLVKSTCTGAFVQLLPDAECRTRVPI